MNEQIHIQQNKVRMNEWMNECVWDGIVSSACETEASVLHCCHMTSLFREWITINTYFSFILQFLAQTSKRLTVWSNNEPKKDIKSWLVSPRSHWKREVKRVALWDILLCTTYSGRHVYRSHWCCMNTVHNTHLTQTRLQTQTDLK